MPVKNMKNRNGAIKTEFKAKDQFVQVDFSGDISGVEACLTDDTTKACWRNDASVFFFAANSYRTSFSLISTEIKKCFEDENEKRVQHLIMPYYFNFRHYLELEFKALIIALTGASPKATHDLQQLFDEVVKCVNSLNISNCNGLSQTNSQFNKGKDDVIKVVREIEQLLNYYLSMETSVEYYRFLFDKDFGLSSPIVELDYRITDEKLKEVADKINELNLKLSKLVYLNYLF